MPAPESHAMTAADLLSPRVRPRWLAAVQAIRVHQWVKNLLDLEADRRHATKRHRPFASGAVPPAIGVALIPILIIAAVWISWVLLSLRFVAALVLYLLLPPAYSMYLKR